MDDLTIKQFYKPTPVEEPPEVFADLSEALPYIFKRIRNSLGFQDLLDKIDEGSTLIEHEVLFKMMKTSKCEEFKQLLYSHWQQFQPVPIFKPLADGDNGGQSLNFLPYSVLGFEDLQNVLIINIFDETHPQTDKAGSLASKLANLYFLTSFDASTQPGIDAQFFRSSWIENRPPSGEEALPFGMVMRWNTTKNKIKATLADKEGYLQDFFSLFKIFMIQIDVQNMTSGEAQALTQQLLETINEQNSNELYVLLYLQEKEDMDKAFQYDATFGESLYNKGVITYDANEAQLAHYQQDYRKDRLAHDFKSTTNLKRELFCHARDEDITEKARKAILKNKELYFTSILKLMKSMSGLQEESKLMINSGHILRLSEIEKAKDVLPLLEPCQALDYAKVFNKATKEESIRKDLTTQVGELEKEKLILRKFQACQTAFRLMLRRLFFSMVAHKEAITGEDDGPEALVHPLSMHHLLCEHSRMQSILSEREQQDLSKLPYLEGMPYPLLDSTTLKYIDYREAFLLNQWLDEQITVISVFSAGKLSLEDKKKQMEFLFKLLGTTFYLDTERPRFRGVESCLVTVHGKRLLILLVDDVFQRGAEPHEYDSKSVPSDRGRNERFNNQIICFLTAVSHQVILLCDDSFDTLQENVFSYFSNAKEKAKNKLIINQDVHLGVIFTSLTQNGHTDQTDEEEVTLFQSVVSKLAENMLTERSSPDPPTADERLQAKELAESNLWFVQPGNSEHLALNIAGDLHQTSKWKDWIETSKSIQDKNQFNSELKLMNEIDAYTAEKKMRKKLASLEAKTYPQEIEAVKAEAKRSPAHMSVSERLENSTQHGFLDQLRNQILKDFDSYLDNENLLGFKGTISAVKELAEASKKRKELETKFDLIFEFTEEAVEETIATIKEELDSIEKIGPGQTAETEFEAIFKKHRQKFEAELLVPREKIRKLVLELATLNFRLATNIHDLSASTSLLVDSITSLDRDKLDLSLREHMKPKEEAKGGITFFNQKLPRDKVVQSILKAMMDGETHPRAIALRKPFKKPEMKWVMTDFRDFTTRFLIFKFNKEEKFYQIIVDCLKAIQGKELTSLYDRFASYFVTPQKVVAGIDHQKFIEVLEEYSKEMRHLDLEFRVPQDSFLKALDEAFIGKPFDFKTKVGLKKLLMNNLIDEKDNYEIHKDSYNQAPAPETLRFLNPRKMNFEQLREVLIREERAPGAIFQSSKEILDLMKEIRKPNSGKTMEKEVFIVEELDEAIRTFLRDVISDGKQNPFSDERMKLRFIKAMIQQGIKWSYYTGKLEQSVLRYISSGKNSLQHLWMEIDEINQDPTNTPKENKQKRLQAYHDKNVRFCRALTERPWNEGLFRHIKDDFLDLDYRDLQMFSLDISQQALLSYLLNVLQAVKYQIEVFRFRSLPLITLNERKERMLSNFTLRHQEKSNSRDKAFADNSIKNLLGLFQEKISKALQKCYIEKLKEKLVPSDGKLQAGIFALCLGYFKEIFRVADTDEAVTKSQNIEQLAEQCFDQMRRRTENYQFSKEIRVAEENRMKQLYLNPVGWREDLFDLLVLGIQPKQKRNDTRETEPLEEWRALLGGLDQKGIKDIGAILDDYIYNKLQGVKGISIQDILKRCQRVFGPEELPEDLLPLQSQLMDVGSFIAGFNAQIEELVSKFPKEFEEVEVVSLTLQSIGLDISDFRKTGHLKDLFVGCTDCCPLCKRKCSEGLEDSEQHTHKCSHQPAAFGRVKDDDGNPFSLACNAIPVTIETGEDYKISYIGKMKTVDDIQNETRWNFESDIKKLHKNAQIQIWNMFKKDFVKKFYDEYQVKMNEVDLEMDHSLIVKKAERAHYFLLIDGSSSMGYNGGASWTSLKQALKEFISLLLESGKTADTNPYIKAGQKISIIQYSDSLDRKSNLDQFNSLPILDISKKIKDIKMMQGFTNFDKPLVRAIEKCKQIYEDEKKLSEKEQTKKMIIYFMTDGQGKAPNEAFELFGKLNQNLKARIEFTAVGFGPQASKERLKEICSKFKEKGLEKSSTKTALTQTHLFDSMKTMILE